MSIVTLHWKPDSWCSKKISQIPRYRDTVYLKKIQNKLSSLPPLTTSWEVENLKQLLALANEGKVFILQGGDCAEVFSECRPEIIARKLKILFQMGIILSWGLKKPIIKIGRIAGQYAKPRSKEFELVNGQKILTYRGDLINGHLPTQESREPDPERMLKGYFYASLTLNFIRSLVSSGFSDIHHLEYLNLEFAKNSEIVKIYREIVEKIVESLKFVENSLLTTETTLKQSYFFTSHEALLLPYEEALTRKVPRREGWYNLSTHLPWIGVRTLYIDSGHVEYARGIENPIGIKVSPDTESSELTEIIKILNPDNKTGKVVVIHRLGKEKVDNKLPEIIEAVKNKNLNVTWISDPMHGNTKKTANGLKTRNFSDIIQELTKVIAIHKYFKTTLAGVHFELTGEEVTECIGGSSGITEDDLCKQYTTYLDPRLNYEQSLEMAFILANKLSS